MRRPRHRPRRSARLFFPLLSALALMIFACVPALAQAECTDSSCAQYEVEIPTAEGNQHKKKPKKETGGEKEATAGASHESEPKTGGSESEESESESETEKTGATGGNGGNNNSGGGGESNQGNSPGGGNKGSEGLSEGKSLGGNGNEATQQGKPASASSGGSSPLVPILIAVAVLAAISIGAVIYRQRRQGDDGSGSPVSSKAG